MTTEKQPSAIEKIRAEVEGIRKEHCTYEGEEVEIGQLCGAAECAYIWPCLTLRLAESMFRLAETLEWTKSYLDQPQQAHVDNVLTEVAK